MFPEGTVSIICLVITFVVNTLEEVSIKFFFLCFKLRRVCLEICFIIPYHISMMFEFVWTIAFLILRSMWITHKCYMPLLPAVFALRDTQIHICFSDSSNILTYIEASVNKTLCSCTGLWTRNIDLYHHYIGFWECFDNLWVRC